MHIRILAGKLDRTAGSHVYHMQLARRLTARGHRVSLIAFSSDPDVARHSDILEIPDETRRYEQTPLAWRFSSWRRYWQCGRVVRDADLDRPHVVISGEHLLPKAHARKFPGVPWIYLPHGMTVTADITHMHLESVQEIATLALYRRLQRWAMKHSNYVLRFTHRAARFLDSAYPRTGARFVVNTMGVDVPKSSREISTGGVTQLLMVGRLIHQKGMDIAIDALAQIKHRPWRLTIVGDGPLRQQLRERAAPLGDRVSFEGQVDDPSRYYAHSDLLLFPSRAESLGLVALEGMAHGVPVLGFRASSKFSNVNEEIIEHDKTGILAADENEFLTRLDRALDNPESLNALGKNARSAVIDRYSWDHHLDCYESLFESMTKRTHVLC